MFVFSGSVQNSANLYRSKIRSLLIDMRLPKFVKMRKVDITAISNIVKQLNVDQARAVIKSLMAEDFAIIEGFPGSGETVIIFIG